MAQRDPYGLFGKTQRLAREMDLLKGQTLGQSNQLAGVTNYKNLSSRTHGNEDHAPNFAEDSVVVKKDGSVPMTGNFNLGGYVLTNVANCTRTTVCCLASAQDGYTAGDNNVYQNSGGPLLFGKSSQTANHIILMTFVLPADYKSGTALSLVLGLSTASNNDIISYSATPTAWNTDGTYTTGDAVASTFTAVVSYGSNPLTIAIPNNADMVANGMVSISLKLEDDDNVNITYLRGYRLDCTVTGYD